MAAYVLCVCDACCVEAWAVDYSFYKYFKHFKNWIIATQQGNKWGIPDDGLKGSKHVGLFIKSVLSDFSVT